MTRTLTFAACLVVAILFTPFARAEFEEPFDLDTAKGRNVSLQLTWDDLQSQVQTDLDIVAGCRAEPLRCSLPAAFRFLSIIDEGIDYDGVVRIGHINRAVNLAIRGMNGGIPAAWTSPLTALARGVGDCKQFAVLKYAALTFVGYAPDALRILIVEDKYLHRQHAVVAVLEQGQWLLLDNRSSILLSGSGALSRYVPIETLDNRGVRAFVHPRFAQKDALLRTRTLGSQ